MRLLHFDRSETLTSTDFSQKTIPPYAILSHTWGDAEFLFEDLVNDTGKSKAGYEKILFCGEQAARDHLQYFWVDTCCIDKWNLRELSEAINSMFQWYKNAENCYVFLADVSAPVADAQLHQSAWEALFRKSRWFTRGWTLQELLAPTSIEFFSSERQRLGDKVTLEQQINEITRIPVAALRGDPLDGFSVSERKRWMVGRQTTQGEDMAYSLIGIFGVFMDFRYGEGRERALERLQETTDKVNITPFVVPFDRNARFIGREAQLSELREELFVAASTKKVAIAGPSGAGKTQLALELAYRTRQELQGCSVFWITARNKESVHQSCTQIARRLQIPGWDNGKADIKNLVQLHLSQEALGQWLLIIDNVDESEQESAGPFNGAGLMEFLPSSGPGAIVFTTTDRKTAVNLAAQHIVGLQEMDRGIARRMLESSLANPTNEQEKADLLLKELAYLPLAISQAAAYINVNKLTLQQYLSLLLKQKEDLMDLPPQESENVIAATWIISFEQIRRHETLAADYLLFMACVDRNDVPLSLLPAALPREKGMHAVEALNAYSLVTKRTAESALDLHQLVQLSTRNWLQQKGLLGQQTQAAITRLVEVYPDHRHGSRSKWRRLLPHARFALSSGPTGQNYEARVDLVWKCAMTLYSDGRWKEAEELYVQVVEIRKRVLGEEHPDTVASLANLAATYWSQGQWKEAEELFVQVVEIRKVVLGIEHPHTLTSMTNLSSTYRDQGRWKEAEELDVQLVEISSRVFGEHPNTMMSMANLASTYSNQGRWREAEELDVQVMEMFKRELGEEHPLTLSKIADLASTYLCQGRWKEAEELFIHVMETSRRVLGEDHPDTLPSMANLASTYKIQGRWKEAEQLEVQVIEGFRRILGEEHPYTLTSMSHLASTYRTEGRWKEAEELDLQVIETGKRVFGQEHPKMLTSIANLASTYWCQGRWKEAEELNSQVLATRKRVIGEDHPDTLTSMANLASTYRKQGRWKEAEDLFMQVIEIRKVVLGTEHPDTLTSMANLAETLKAQNRNQEAISMIELCFQLRKRVLGGHHPDTESSLGTLTRWQMETMELSH